MNEPRTTVYAAVGIAKPHPARTPSRPPLLLVGLLACGLLLACPAAEPPPVYETITLEGSAYDRGFAHGERFASKIRSIYTQLLTSSILPSLNRERPDIAAVLITYTGEDYDDGRFAHQVLLESAYALEEFIPERYVDEMRGIAAGAGLPYEQILILNTFVDAVLGVRTLQRFLDQWQAPTLTSVEIVGDGLGDEEIWRFEPYAPLPHAHFVGVPVDASLRLVIEDETGVDPATVRVRLGDDYFTDGDAGLTFVPLDDEGVRLEVLFTPPGGFPAAQASSIGVEAGNRRVVVDPPPTRVRFMRPVWITLATEGLNKTAEEVPNMADDDTRFPPPPIAFAAQGPATPDGALRVAHHFALLDAGSAHKHLVLFAHRPDDGHPHVSVGWAGMVGGFSGMNSEGLVWTVNHADSLDNPVVGEVRRNLIAAKLLSSGMPISMIGREVLRLASNVDTAAGILVDTPTSVGWTHLVAGEGGMKVVEASSDIMGRGDRADHVYDQTTLDHLGRRLASEGEHDLRAASHFESNTEDIDVSFLTFHLTPQRFWSPWWHRSIRAFNILGDRMNAAMGELDTEKMIEILRVPSLVHARDSMNAVVFEPETMTLRLAGGVVPATDGPFEPHDVAEFLEVGR